MRRRIVLLLLSLQLGFLAAVGCNRFTGPLETRRLGRVDPKDDKGNPIYSIPEQQERGRERLAIPEDDFRIGPNTYSSRPSPTGR